MNSTLKSGERIAAVDWIKGALVVLMVVYHSFGYARLGPISYQYLAFIRPSFIFIAGFLITSSYLARFGVREWKMHRRLMIRGTKLIMLFTLMNFLPAVFLAARQGLMLSWFDQFAENWQAIYFFPVGKIASFTILLSIGYLLLASPLLLLLQSWSTRLLAILATCFVVIGCFQEWSGVSNDHWEMVGAGVLGMAIGVFPLDKIGRLARRWFAILLLYLSYRIFSYIVGEPYLVRLVGACISLLLLNGLALSFNPERYWYRQFILLGRYSLFGYIFQLVVLQTLVRIPLILSPEELVLLLISITLFVTWLTTKLLDKLLGAIPALDSTYRAIFA